MAFNKFKSKLGGDDLDEAGLKNHHSGLLIFSLNHSFRTESYEDFHAEM